MVHSLLPNNPWIAWLIIFLVFILAILFLLKPLVDYSIKKFLAKQDKQHGDSYKCREMVNKQINEHLESVRTYLHSNRALIVEYHNGGQNLSGLQFQHLSCTYERLDAGTKSIAMKLNKLPLTLFPNLLEDLSNSDVIYTNKATVFEKKYPVLGAILSSKKVKEFIIMPLTGISNPIGFILIEKTNHEGFTKDDRVYLNRLIQKITMLLDYKKSNVYGKC